MQQCVHRPATAQCCYQVVKDRIEQGAPVTLQVYQGLEAQMQQI